EDPEHVRELAPRIEIGVADLELVADDSIAAAPHADELDLDAIFPVERGLAVVGCEPEVPLQRVAGPSAALRGAEHRGRGAERKADGRTCERVEVTTVLHAR